MWLGKMGFGDGGLGRIRGRANLSAISDRERERERSECRVH